MPSVTTPTTIPETFAATVKASPERTFLLEQRSGELASFDFGHVDRHVQALARSLVSRGVQPGDKVTIMSPNCAEWPVAFLAVLRAGGVAVPLYSELSHDEVERLVKASHSKLVMGPDDVIGRLKKFKTPALTWPGQAPFSLDESLAPIEGENGTSLTAARKAEDLAVIIYTSGTTARPKGVMLSHRNFLSNVESFLQLVKVGPDDRLLMVLPFHHAFPLTVGLLAAMKLGGSLAVEQDVRKVANRMAETKPTIFFGVPLLYDTVLRTVQQRIDRERGPGSFDKLIRRLSVVKRATGINVGPVLLRPLRQRLGGKLRFMVSGGAPLDPATCRGFFQLGIPLIQGYGLTEAAPACAAQPFSMLRFMFTKHYENLAGSVGRALPGVKLALADVPERGIKVAIDGEGELLVKGPNVMMGYYENEEATREAIEDGWLHTGDLARIDDKGWVYITGRAKDVIVLDSGENIHPEEVEEALAQNPLVADACLAIAGRRQRDLVLVVHPNLEEASVEPEVARDQKALKSTVERVVGQELQSIAAYKRPSRVILASEPLPRTLLGKVQRYQVTDKYL